MAPANLQMLTTSRFHLPVKPTPINHVISGPVLSCKCTLHKATLVSHDQKQLLEYRALFLSNLSVVQGAAADRKILGDATDCGLLRYCERLVTSQWIRARWGDKLGSRKASAIALEYRRIACVLLNSFLPRGRIPTNHFNSGTGRCAPIPPRTLSENHPAPLCLVTGDILLSVWPPLLKHMSYRTSQRTCASPVAA